MAERRAPVVHLRWTVSNVLQPYDTAWCLRRREPPTRELALTDDDNAITCKRCRA